MYTLGVLFSHLCLGFPHPPLTSHICFFLTHWKSCWNTNQHNSKETQTSILPPQRAGGTTRKTKFWIMRLQCKVTLCSKSSVAAQNAFGVNVLAFDCLTSSEPMRSRCYPHPRSREPISGGLRYKTRQTRVLDSPALWSFTKQAIHTKRQPARRKAHKDGHAQIQRWEKLHLAFVAICICLHSKTFQTLKNPLLCNQIYTSMWRKLKLSEEFISLFCLHLCGEEGNASLQEERATGDFRRNGCEHKRSWGGVQYFLCVLLVGFANARKSIRFIFSK